jgi:uncharacterized repeat protein (TIGR03803 family)
MTGKRPSIGLRAALAIFTVTLFVTSTRAASWERVLYSFGNGTDGSNPVAGLVMDTRGNLYGTTAQGGVYGSACVEYGACGTVFQLAHKVGGGWTETVLHSFGNGTDGVDPRAGLIFDAAGHLYGTTFDGGAYTYYGTVFELRQQGVELWTEKVLHSFNDADGGYSPAGLIFDAAGNLYGTSIQGGDGDGIVFELSPEAGGGWPEKLLYSFDYTDGSGPSGGLIFDAAGNLYGTTYSGGAYGHGEVFQLSPNADGSWTETVLHSFASGGDGQRPADNLIFDAAGNLYGTTAWGGDLTKCHVYEDEGCGTVFELSPQAGGGWTEQVLHIFGSGADGSGPSGLVMDTRGNLYGTTGSSGAYGDGTVFELSPQVGGDWTEKVLHDFNPKCHNDGVNPAAGLIMDAAGNLYGTTQDGGVYGKGTVFEITP